MLGWLDKSEHLNHHLPLQDRALDRFFCELNLVGNVEKGYLPHALTIAEVNVAALKEAMKKGIVGWIEYGTNRVTRKNMDILGYENGEVNMDGRTPEGL